MANTPSAFNKDGDRIKFYSLSTRQSFDFLAFLTDFSDNFKSNWATQEIYGKMDPIYTYKNTVRSITLAFDVPSYDEAESIDNGKKADLLIQSLYPVYDREINNAKPGGKGVALIAAPPLFRIKFSNLIMKMVNTPQQATDDAQLSGLLGWIDGFSFKPDLEAGFFIKTGTGHFIAPKLFKVNFTFNVIHEHPLGQEIDGKDIKRRVLSGQKSPFAHGFETKTSLETPDVQGPRQVTVDTVAAPANQVANALGNISDSSLLQNGVGISIIAARDTDLPDEDNFIGSFTDDPVSPVVTDAPARGGLA